VAELAVQIRQPFPAVRRCAAVEHDEAARAVDTDWPQIPKGATSSRKRPG